jgi:spore germination cell wall hydrolase CwlJ-like protein
LRQWFADALRAGGRALVLVLCTLLGTGPGTAISGELTFTIVPATLSPAIAQARAAAPSVDAPAKLTPELLEAYVQRQQQLKTFSGFDVRPHIELNETVLLSYIAKQRNHALEAIAHADLTPQPVLTSDMVEAYAQDDYVPTISRVKVVSSEELCLAQAIYHEARGESEQGQLAVANIIINRVLSKKYPSTVCGVVFQKADNGRYRCQFTFACDGRSDMGTEHRAWAKAAHLADLVYREFQLGQRPGVVPSNALYYHTTAVSPKWSNTMHRVAAIGAHVFYAAN